MAFSSLGILFRSVVVGYAAPGTSGRNRHGQFADSLNTTGLYSIMRHPLYLGNFICIFGLLAASMVWWVILVGALAFWIMTIQIVNVEETFLKSKFGIEYNQWASVTPAFIPKFHNWQKPSQKFNWREVLSREYNGIMALGAAFLVREAFEDLYGERMNFIKWMIEDKSWIILFFVCLVILLTLRTVRKKTNLLSQN